MKKFYRYYIFIILCLSLPIFVSCKEERKMKNDVYFEGYTVNDTDDLETALTKKYDIEELNSFFKNTNIEEGNARRLFISDVDKKFPIEIIRSVGYSVYKVRQGGYFYVFWLKVPSDYVEMIGDSIEILGAKEPIVYFTTYISSPSRPSSLFDVLEIGKSGAVDVHSIDPYFELELLRSSGKYSYSFLDDKNLLEIEYIRQGESEGYIDFIIKDMKIVPRNNSYTMYGSILSKDIPGT